MRALCLITVKPGIIDRVTETLLKKRKILSEIKIDWKTSYEGLLSFLSINHYKRVESVASPGEFVVRGGIVDVYSFGRAAPMRAGFLGDRQEVLFFNSSLPFVKMIINPL